MVAIEKSSKSPLHENVVKEYRFKTLEIEVLHQLQEYLRRPESDIHSEIARHIDTIDTLFNRVGKHDSSSTTLEHPLVALEHTYQIKRIRQKSLRDYSITAQMPNEDNPFLVLRIMQWKNLVLGRSSSLDIFSRSEILLQGKQQFIHRFMFRIPVLIGGARQEASDKINPRLVSDGKMKTYMRQSDVSYGKS